MIANLIEIKEYFGASFRPYIVTEKKMNTQDILGMLLHEGFFSEDEKIRIEEENNNIFFTGFDKMVIVKQKPIPFERNN